MADLLKLLAKWWPDFWPLMIAPPIYGIWLTFLSGPKWTGRIRGWLQNEAWSGAYIEILSFLNSALDMIFGRRFFSYKSVFISVSIVLFYTLFWTMVITIFIAESYKDKIAISAIVLMVFNFFMMIFMRGGFSQEIIKLEDFRKFHWSQYGNLIILMMNQFFGMMVPYLAIVSFPVFIVSFGSSSLIYFPNFNKFDNFSFLASIFVVCINIYFDFISWSATRFLLRRLVGDISNENIFYRWFAIFLHVSADVVIALLSLFGLSIMLCVIFYENLLWSATYNQPFSLIGSTLTIMLLSTLLPTAIHLFCAIFSVLPSLPIGHRRIATFMPFHNDFEEFEAGDRMVVAAWLTLWSVISVFVVWWIFKAGVWLLNSMWAADPENRNFWQVLLDMAHVTKQWMGIG